MSSLSNRHWHDKLHNPCNARIEAPSQQKDEATKLPNSVRWKLDKWRRDLNLHQPITLLMTLYSQLKQWAEWTTFTRWCTCTQYEWRQQWRPFWWHTSTRAANSLCTSVPTLKIGKKDHPFYFFILFLGQGADIHSQTSSKLYLQVVNFSISEFP